MAHEQEITRQRQNPISFRKQDDLTPENFEKMKLWLDERLNGIEVQISDHEARIRALE